MTHPYVASVSYQFFLSPWRVKEDFNQASQLVLHIIVVELTQTNILYCSDLVLHESKPNMHRKPIITKLKTIFYFRHLSKHLR